MIISNENAIKKHIKADEKARVYLVYGDESYLVNHYAGALASSVADTSGMSFNYYYFDAETVSFDAVYEACETLPVMSDKVCVYVKDFPFVKAEKGAKKESKTENSAQQYLDYLPDVPDTAVLIFHMASVEVDAKRNPKWNPVINAFDKNGAVICVKKRTESEIISLIKRSVKARNASISDDTAEYFLSIVGSEMNVMRNELDKLTSYAGGKEITKEMIDDISIKSVEASVFELTEAINGNKSDRAYEILSELLREKVKPESICGTIAFGYVDIYRAKIAQLNEHGINDYLPVFDSYKNNSFRLRKAAPTAKRLTLEQIKEMLDAVVQADIKIKTSGMRDGIVFEELIAKLLYIAGGKK